MIDGEMKTYVIQLAQRIAQDARSAIDDIQAPDRAQRLARRQLRAMIVTLKAWERTLDGPGSELLVSRIARASRALYGNEGESDVRMAACLANAVDMAVHFVNGDEFALPKERLEALRVAVKSVGVDRFAMTMFAAIYPEKAAKIDRECFAHLVEVWIGAAQGGRWPAIARVVKERFGRKVEPLSIKNEMTKLRSARLKNLMKSPSMVGLGAER